jgi:putative NADPH-quinone reductase
VPESLIAARDAIVSAQHVTMIFPLWHGTMPALLKAFIEQVMRPGVALRYRERSFPQGLLAGRSARLVVTMGMPAMIYRWYFRAHGCAVWSEASLGSPACAQSARVCSEWLTRRVTSDGGAGLRA